MGEKKGVDQSNQGEWEEGEKGNMRERRGRSQ